MSPDPSPQSDPLDQARSGSNGCWNIPFEWIERTLNSPDWTDTDPRQSDRPQAVKAIPELVGLFQRTVFRPKGQMWS